MNIFPTSQPPPPIWFLPGNGWKVTTVRVRNTPSGQEAHHHTDDVVAWQIVVFDHRGEYCVSVQPTVIGVTSLSDEVDQPAIYWNPDHPEYVSDNLPPAVRAEVDELVEHVRSEIATGNEHIVIRHTPWWEAIGLREPGQRCEAPAAHPHAEQGGPR